MKRRGFTLIDLMVALAIFAVLAALCTVSLPAMIEKNEQQVIADELTGIIQFARNQALLSGRSVYITPLDVGNDWTQGVLLAHKKTVLHESELIREWRWHYPCWRIRWRGASAETLLVISANPMNAMHNGRFIITNLRTQTRFTLVLNRLGRIRLAT